MNSLQPMICRTNPSVELMGMSFFFGITEAFFKNFPGKDQPCIDHGRKDTVVEDGMLPDDGIIVGAKIMKAKFQELIQPLGCLPVRDGI